MASENSSNKRKCAWTITCYNKFFDKSKKNVKSSPRLRTDSWKTNWGKTYFRLTVEKKPVKKNKKEPQQIKTFA